MRAFVGCVGDRDLDRVTERSPPLRF